MRNLYSSRVLSGNVIVSSKRTFCIRYFTTLLLVLFTCSGVFAQQRLAEKKRILAEENLLGKNSVQPTPKEAALNQLQIERAKEKEKFLQREAQQPASQVINERVASIPSLMRTEALTLLSGTLSVADPTFNRTLIMAQGGSCGLSSVGTAVHYKTHSFTLATSGNVTVSLLAADGASITPGSADSFLGLYGPGGFIPATACANLIAANDDFSGSLSKIQTTTPLPAGNYTVVVTSFSNTPPDFPWNYSVALITPDPGPCPNAIIYAYNFNNDHLVSFNANAPGTLLTDIAVTGLNPGEFLSGIDFRPSDGLLYGIATDFFTDRVVRVNTTTGAITAVGGSYPTPSGIFFGADINPVVDRLRLVDDAENNLRLNPNDGSVTGTDVNLAYVGGDPNAGANPAVVHVAYTNSNNPAPANTTLFGIDATTDALVRIGGVNGAPSPNGGGLTTIGSLGVNTTSFGGFDIEPLSNQAYAVLRIAGASQLFTINLTTGAATLVGTVGSGGLIIDGVAISQVCVACVAPTVTTQPVNVNACAGSGASFSIVAGGTSPTYQWQVNTGSGFTNISNGGAYSGATTATLTINPVTAAMGGYQYRCAVTNSCGGPVNSNAATLTSKSVTHTAIAATPTVVCSPGATVITATASGSAGANAVINSSGPINLAIPDGNAAGINSTIVLPAVNFASAADLKLRLNMSHSWVGDLRVRLTTPCGTTLVFDRPGVPATLFGNSSNLGTNNSATPPAAEYIFDIAGATIIPEASLPSGFIPGGTYQPSDASNPGFAHNWAGLTFPCGAGNWVLNLADNVGGDVGVLVDWAILKTNNYTHTLAGPGTIAAPVSSGPNNSSVSFNVTAIPAGVQTYTLTSTDAAGCSVSSNVVVTVNATPVVTIAPAAPVICNGALQQLTATVAPPLPQLVTGGGTVTIGTSAGPANPYPSTLVVTGLPTTGVTIKSVTLNGVSHSFPSDLDILLQSPTNGNVVLLSDRGGATPISNINLTFDDAAAAIAPSPLVAGTHRPTNLAGPDNFPAPGPGSVNQVNPTLGSLGSTSDYNGAWKLFVNDQFTLDGGSITSWSITFNIPVPVTWTAGAGGAGTIFTDPAGTIAYVAGTPTILPVYVKPTATTTSTVTSYTATATRAGCTGSATVNVTTNALPAITTQPTPATQTICPGFNVVYSVAATGTGLTYQWRKNGVNLVNGVQASGSLVSGATTNSVTLIGVVSADAGTYTVVVSGTCTPSVTSANAVLVIASAPVISTQPTNRTVCEGLPTTFTVAATGSPAPTIYQWQVSTNGGGLWTNLTTGGSYTTSFTIPAVTVVMSGNLYRVIVTNSCGQSTTSGNATLTVPALTPVTATALPAAICLSDGPIALVGSPVGGTWSGIGVSGSNFVPSATAVGTYTLTYTYTNGSGCVSTTTVTAKVVAGQACGRINLLRDNAVILYPNPNDGRFNIRINSTLYDFLGMQVYSSSGQLVHKQLFSNLVYGQVIAIDLSKLPSGPYMVKFYHDGGIRTSDKTFTVFIGRQ